jgi:hypothetical protein
MFGNLQPANIGKVMGGDGGSVTDGYSRQVNGLVKVNQQQQKAVQKAIAFRDAIKSTADQVTGNLTQAVQKFQEKWERTKGVAFDAQTAAMIANTPAARELAQLQADSDAAQQAREDAANQQALAEAQASGDPNQIADAQFQIDETARQRRIAVLQAQVEKESAAIEETRAKERQKALDTDTAEFEKNEQKKSQKLIKQLAQRTISYAQFVKRINRMLAAIGGGEFTGNASDEAAVVAGFSAKQLKALGLTPAQMQRILQQAGALDGDQILDSFASGTPFVKRTGLYELHRGERVVPADENRAGAGAVVINEYGDRHYHTETDLELDRRRRALSLQTALRGR